MLRFAVPPSASSVQPLYGPTSGGTTVTITGSSFVPTGTVVVRFLHQTTSASVSATVLSSTSLKCVTPSFVGSVVAQVSVSLNGDSYTSQNVLFNYYRM